MGFFDQTFAGDKKDGMSLLGKWEKRFRDHYVDRIPTWIETYHLTLSTIIWSLGIIGFSFLAQYHSIHWLWGVSIMIFGQYLTDLFDGAVGRKRNTGLIKWGYYMDHFLDYIFLASILIGYGIILPDNFKYLLFFVLAIFGAFMVNAFLAFAATNTFKISYLGIGPTEIRLLFICINTALILFGKTYLAPALPYILILATLGLIITVYRTQQHIWKIDMQAKKNIPSSDR